MPRRVDEGRALDFTSKFLMQGSECHEDSLRLLNFFIEGRPCPVHYAGQTRFFTLSSISSRHVKINGSPVSLTENSAVFRKTDF